MTLSSHELVAGGAVILYLHAPKEKIWGVLVSVSPAGVVVRGMDLTIFDDWMRQEARGQEPLLGPTTAFYPMHRLERMERDERVGTIEGCADRFAREVGKTVWAVLGLPGEGE